MQPPTGCDANLAVSLPIGSDCKSEPSTPENIPESHFFLWLAFTFHGLTRSIGLISILVLPKLRPTATPKFKKSGSCSQNITHRLKWFRLRFFAWANDLLPFTRLSLLPGCPPRAAWHPVQNLCYSGWQWFHAPGNVWLPAAALFPALCICRRGD